MRSLFPLIVFAIGFSYCQSQDLKLAGLAGHTNWLNSAVLSPDGKKAMTSSRDHTVKVWNAETGDLLLDLKGQEEECSASFSPDGKWILSQSSDSTAKVWDAGSGKLLNVLRGHKGVITSASFSPDGKRIFTDSFDATAKVWDTETGQILLDFNNLSLFDSFKGFFSPDSKKILVNGWNDEARLFDIEKHIVITHFQGYAGAFRSATFSANNEEIITIGDSIKFWNAKSGNLLHVTKNGTINLNQATYSPDGINLLAHQPGGVPKIFNISENRAISFNRDSIEVSTAAFSPDGKMVATSGGWEDHDVRIWNVATGRLLIILKGHSLFVKHIAFSSDGKKIITASADTTAKVWNARTGELLTDLRNHSFEVIQTVFSPDGSKILSVSSDLLVRIWDIETGRIINEHPEAFRSAVVSIEPERKTFKLSNYKSSLIIVPSGLHGEGRQAAAVYVWDENTDTLVASLKWERYSLQHANFSVDGKMILSISYNDRHYYNVSLWDAATGSYLGTIRPKYISSYFGEPISSDGKKILKYSENYGLNLIDGQTGNLLNNFPAGDTLKRPAIFSDDGRKIAGLWSGGDAGISDMVNRSRIIRLRHPKTKWSELSFSTSAKLIATSSTPESHGEYQFIPGGFQTIKENHPVTAGIIWNAENGQKVSELVNIKASFSGIKFSPDDNLVLATSTEGAVKIWKAKTGQLVSNLKVYKSTVSSVFFFPDSKRIITISTKDKSAHVWNAITGVQITKMKIGDYAKVDFKHNKLVTVIDNAICLYNIQTGQLLSSMLAIGNNDYFFSPGK